MGNLVNIMLLFALCVSNTSNAFDYYESPLCVSNRSVKFELVNSYYLINQNRLWVLCYQYGENTDLIMLGKENILSYSFNDFYIWGKYDSGYFIAKADIHNWPKEGKEKIYSRYRENFLFFNKETEWKNYLQNYCSIFDYILIKPEEYSSKLPRKQLKPYLYKYFRGFLGLSDMTIIIILMVISSMYLGIKSQITQSEKIIKHSIVSGVVFGVFFTIVNLEVADLACVSIAYGIFFMPIVSYLIAKLFLELAKKIIKVGEN